MILAANAPTTIRTGIQWKGIPLTPNIRLQTEFICANKCH